VGVAGTFAETTLEDLDWIVGINFWGVIASCKLFLPYLCAEDEGHIVNLSSVLGFIGIPGQSAYCATKFAVRGFSEALYAELSGTGVGVTSVHPGAVRTNIVRASRFYDRQAQQKILSRFERAAIPPERVARAIVRAIERRKLRVIVGADSHVLERAKRLLPVLFHRAAAWTYRRYGVLA
jgi:short-subunit dehydrogenase